MKSETVTLHVENRVAIVTLDNPPVNSLNTVVLGELEETLTEISKDQVRGVVITGKGKKSFCAGADILELSSSKDKAIELIEKGRTVFDKVEKFDWPVVAAINGVALGGGNELAISCDIRVSSNLAKFSQPEVSQGLIPAWGGTRRLARLVGLGLAKEMILTGKTIDALEAYRMGLVNKVVPDGEELSAGVELLRKISTSSPLALVAAKKAINEGEKDSEIREMNELATTGDFREGIEAFLQKRSPKFHGN